MNAGTPKHRNPLDVDNRVWLFALFGVSIVVLARFAVTSPLWLDEALSVNIAKESLGSIPGHLKSDGHPPLYYGMLHVWITIFGSSVFAVRALSAMFSLLSIGAAYVAGTRLGSITVFGGTPRAEANNPTDIDHENLARRRGVTTALVTALSPFLLRYGSETRMYSLIILLVFLGFILIVDLRKEPSVKRVAGVAVISAALVWTHYWSLWLIGATGMLMLFSLYRAQRGGDNVARKAQLQIIGAITVGSLTFIGWLPTFWYQSQHTGTPWAPSFRPATLVITSMVDFAGGPYSEAQLNMVLLLLLSVIGCFGAMSQTKGIHLNFTIAPDARPIAAILGLTAAVASAVGLATGIAFAPRYAAIYFPFTVMLIALGIDRFVPGKARNVILVFVVLFGVGSSAFVFRQTRSQSQEIADAVASIENNPLIVVCPDQLGPALSKTLPNAELLVYPDFEPAEFVNWVDYAEQNEQADPAAFAQKILDDSNGRPIALIYSDTYLTLEGQCNAVQQTIGAARRGNEIVKGDGEQFYEPMTLVLFDEQAE